MKYEFSLPEQAWIDEQGQDGVLGDEHRNYLYMLAILAERLEDIADILATIRGRLPVLEVEGV